MARLTEETVKYVQFCVFSITAFLTVRVYSVTHYCVNGNTERIQGESTGTIKTLENGQSIYGNNMNCSWLLDAGLSDRIQLKTTLFDIQYTPNYVSCYGNDNLQIYNGETSSSPVLGSICGTNNPYEVISKGRYLLLTWWTNDKNFYRRQGIHIDFEVFPNDACPPDWSYLSSTDDCIKLMLNPPKGADWSDSQHYCGYSQSNLATYTSLSQFEFVQANLSRPGTTHVWLGLNDIEEESTYKWLDGSPPSIEIRNKFDTSFSSTLRDCVIHNFFTEDLMAKECKRERYHFLCLQKQDGTTTVYRVPEASPETTGHRSNFSKEAQAWIISVMVIVCLLLGLIIYGSCRLRAMRRKERRARSQYIDVVQEEVDGVPIVEERPRRRCEGPGVRPTPPGLLTQPVGRRGQQSSLPPTYSEAVTHG